MTNLFTIDKSNAEVAIILGTFFITFVILYIIWTIKKEDDSYPKQYQKYLLGSFQLKIPTWWGYIDHNAKINTKESNKEKKEGEPLRFKRLDTHYDWLAEIKLPSNHSLSAFDLIDLYLQDEKIDLDTQQYTEKTFSSYKVTRVESTGTRDQTKRVYLDLAIVEDKKGHKLQCLSLSSVLNGMLEGPYFEKMLENIEIKA